jgi:predicted nucleic acid-binding protein
LAERIFLDTNILIYAFAEDHRQTLARRLIREPFELSVQSLNEFANAARRKLQLDWERVEWALGDLIEACQTIHPLTLDIHLRGVALAERFNLQFYDATLLASAIKGGCTIFLSEDMQDGMIIEDRLIIRNPFNPV